MSFRNTTMCPLVFTIYGHSEWNGLWQSLTKKRIRCKDKLGYQFIQLQFVFCLFLFSCHIVIGEYCYRKKYQLIVVKAKNNYSRWAHHGYRSNFRYLIMNLNDEIWVISSYLVLLINWIFFRSRFPLGHSIAIVDDSMSFSKRFVFFFFSAFAFICTTCKYTITNIQSSIYFHILCEKKMVQKYLLMKSQETKAQYKKKHSKAWQCLQGKNLL